MQLFLLKNIKGNDHWEPWYDKAFGFVVRAENEQEAREIASKKSGDEEPEAWLNKEHSTCVELSAEGNAEIILRDFNAA